MFEGENWVRWSRARAESNPELIEQIEAFDAGPLPAGETAAEWLREAGLVGESIPYLLVEDNELLGFYALTAGEVQLSSHHRKQYGLAHPTQ